MADQRAFDFGGAHAVARDIDHIVDAARDPVIAVLVAAAAVSGEIFAAVGAEIGQLEAFVIAIDRARLTGPAMRDAQIALGRAVEHRALIVDQLWPNTEERPARAARLHVVGRWQGGDHHAAGFGLPPGVDDGAAFFADDVEVPSPGFRVDRLTHRAEQA